MESYSKYHPKVSIITISYNAQNVVEETIRSVLNQSYDNIEYLVIDGCSRDNTMEIIGKYKADIAKIVSEKDNGIYDAMNKGIDICSGEWCLFLNCGDYLYSADSIKKAVALFNIDADVVYGDTEYRFDYGNDILKPKALGKVLEGAFCCHQSAFFKTQTIRAYKYDLSYKIVADWALFRRMYLDKCKFQYIDVVVSSYDNSEGASTANNASSFLMHQNEKARCMGRDKDIKWRMRIWFRTICFVVRRKVNRFLPRPFYNRIKKIWIHTHR